MFCLQYLWVEYETSLTKYWFTKYLVLRVGGVADAEAFTFNCSRPL